MGSLSHSVPFVVPRVEIEEKQDDDGSSVADAAQMPPLEAEAESQNAPVQSSSWVRRLTTFLESLIDHDAFPGSNGMLSTVFSYAMCCVLPVLEYVCCAQPH